MTGEMELQQDDGPRLSLSIGPGFGRCSGISLKFARRFAERITKRAGNTRGDRWKKTRRLTARMLEATGVAGFLNNGIRAKVFVRKISFKLRVMRLNRIELFYAFLLCFCNKRSKDRGQPAMARPSTGVVGHGQAPHRDDRLLLSSPTKGRPTATKSPYKGATGCCQGQQPPAGTTTCSAAPVRLH
ncbi:hypothetical protein BHE74_00031403 [Ensete ventricosum]|nr:hypothetical protein BHE74_00031403 [Ensete ventricosum]